MYNLFSISFCSLSHPLQPPRTLVSFAVSFSFQTQFVSSVFSINILPFQHFIQDGGLCPSSWVEGLTIVPIEVGIRRLGSMGRRLVLSISGMSIAWNWRHSRAMHQCLFNRTTQKNTLLRSQMVLLSSRVLFIVQLSNKARKKEKKLFLKNITYD